MIVKRIYGMHSTIGLLFLLCAGSLTAAPITLAGALEKALENNPVIQIAVKEARAAEYLQQQEGQFSNPELEVATENLGMNEVEVMISQSFPIGAAKSSRVEIRAIEVGVAREKLALAKLQVQASVYQKFYSVLAAQKRIALIDSVLGIAEADMAQVKKRVFAGAAMALDTLRSVTDFENITLEKNDLTAEYRASLSALSLLLRDSMLLEYTVQGTFEGDIPTIILEDVTSGLANHPELKMSRAEYAVSKFEVAKAQGEVLPELTLSGGMKRNNENGESAGIFAVGVQIPIFNRNQGAIAAGQEHESAVRVALHSLKRERQVEVEMLVAEMTVLRDKIGTLETRIVPNYAVTFTTLKEYYERGLVPVRDVLESRQEYLEQKLQVIDLRYEWFEKAAALQLLTGYSRHLETALLK